MSSTELKEGMRVMVDTPDQGTTSTVRGRVEQVDTRPTATSTETLYFVRLWNGDGQWLSADRVRIDETDAASWAPFAAKSTIADLGTLLEVGEERMSYGTLADLDRLKDLGVEVDPDGFVDTDSAINVLYEYPLCVEATTTFEVVLGTGGPDSRLMFECSRDGDEGFTTYEVRRVFYRYSWEGSKDVELTGEDRETAEAFARRVVPELADA